MESYTMEEALNIMAQRTDTGDPEAFSIRFPTCSVTRNTGGEWIFIKRAGMFTSESFRNHTASKAEAKAAGEPGRSRNWAKAIRNIQNLETGDVHKVHVILIDKINGIQVTL